MWEDDLYAVLCCVAGEPEDDVVASPGGKDANTVSEVAAVCFLLLSFSS